MESDRWQSVEIRHLAALQAVAEERSFGRAAVRLGYTQSAVSQQIATLERAVGVPLVERPGGPRPVSLTEAGDVLLGHADGIVARLRAAQADLAALADGVAGSLRVGTYQSAGTRILPEVLLRFTAAHPNVEVHLTEAEDDELFSLVEAGDLDLAFIALPLPEGPFEARELLEDPYTLVVPAGSAMSRMRRLPTLREIAEQPVVSYRTCRATQAVEGFLTGLGPELRVVFRSDDNGTVQAMVAAGVGVAIMPSLAADPADRRVKVLPMPAVPPRVVCVVWHRDRRLSPTARSFVSHAEDYCGGAGEDAAIAG
jgi:DNA-binding transcriptional LysR family regulator